MKIGIDLSEVKELLILGLSGNVEAAEILDALAEDIEFFDKKHISTSEMKLFDELNTSKLMILSKNGNSLANKILNKNNNGNSTLVSNA